MGTEAPIRKRPPRPGAHQVKAGRGFDRQHAWHRPCVGESHTHHHPSAHATSPLGARRAPFVFTANGSIFGNFSVRLNATDNAGNFVERTADILIDDQPPVIESIIFENAFTNDLIGIFVNATDNIGVKSVTADISFLNATAEWEHQDRNRELVHLVPSRLHRYRPAAPVQWSAAG